MARAITDRRDMEFILYEQLEVENLFKTGRYEEFNRKMCDMIIAESAKFAIDEVLPTYSLADREGASFDDGKVKAPPCFHRPYELARKGDWFGLTKNVEYGGQGLPHVIAQAAREYLIGANYAFSIYPTLAEGAGIMIELFGTKKQKELFLENLYNGKWAGTMLLTEPEAGSDVGNLCTSARKNPDGTYSITGDKIFISNGDQDITENIIHPVLARIEGAPKGVKGISLFIVPKILVNDDGSLGEPNNIVCTRLEEKMGLHASPTCCMTLGGKGECKGFLLGRENRGMEIMFHMMNEVRLEVGSQSFALASTAYTHALNYAKERLQGRDLESKKDPGAPQVPIIRHPDVRRMLLWMKSHVEGMRSLIYYVAYGMDREKCAESDEIREYYNDIISLLTPVVKAYCSERGFEICVQAMQVFGGYGYTKDYPLEQLVRDCKISSIYEGTDGIQAMDLLGRKMMMKNGAAFKSLVAEMEKTIEIAGKNKELENLVTPVKKALENFKETAESITSKVKSPALKYAFSFAFPFLDVTGDMIMAWMHLWRASIAAAKLPVAKSKGKKKDAAFYDGQIKTAAYYIRSVLPVTMGKMESIKICDPSIVDMDEKSFG